LSLVGAGSHLLRLGAVARAGPRLRAQTGADTRSRQGACLMRIAVIGSGISGLASAWLLSRQHEVTLFEANDYLGGHTHTHDLEHQDQRYRIDSGFIGHNPEH